MNITVRGIHYNPGDDTRAYLDKKLARLSFANDYLQDLDITLTRNTLGQGYRLDAKVHFTWGAVKMVSTDTIDLFEGIDAFADKLESVVRKEKGKVRS